MKVTLEHNARYEWMFTKVPRRNPGWVTAAGYENTNAYTNGRHLFSKSYLVWL